MRLPLLILLTLLSCVGCVERQIRVKSEPSNAEVLINDQWVGRTPVQVPFHYYGVREILVRSPGYQSQVKELSITPPWWQIFPIDFFTDVLLPLRFTDVHEITIKLRPAPSLDPGGLEELRDRAESLREQPASPEIPGS
ncbi:MAG: PEGA domain-containing protein [Planctomycetota bacterium]|nr:PEGA domain-containing protein [Planctomycetota bacterium]